ncbi:hypothetical protein M404DRAFT_1005523 [Pisolithus tinctorius Marx 270]|uniref:Uncharacterized protein n=1 Tax=Pisolithus tinctorius Marx 270 TaxID=870435 RepID=A0A0C3NS96_PISTI|nr:hypothetical protein M404DRAFT_1005523 [Pisolithus tinctorius Marx 270]
MHPVITHLRTNSRRNLPGQWQKECSRPSDRTRVYGGWRYVGLAHSLHAPYDSVRSPLRISTRPSRSPFDHAGTSLVSSHNLTASS